MHRCLDRCIPLLCIVFVVGILLCLYAVRSFSVASFVRSAVSSSFPQAASFVLASFVRSVVFCSAFCRCFRTSISSPLFPRFCFVFSVVPSDFRRCCLCYCLHRCHRVAAPSRRCSPPRHLIRRLFRSCLRRTSSSPVTLSPLLYIGLVVAAAVCLRRCESRSPCFLTRAIKFWGGDMS
jgi:hypothetical protein